MSPEMINMEVWGGLSGVAFGAVIYNGSIHESVTLSQVHLITAMNRPRFIVTAMLMAAVGVLGLPSAGLSNSIVIFSSQCVVGIAGLLFGLGLSGNRYPANPRWTWAAENQIDTVVALFGGMPGILLLVVMNEYLMPLLQATEGGDIQHVHCPGCKYLAVGIFLIVFVIGIRIIDIACEGTDRL
ncbi:MAG: hypothetical protein SWH61_02430 [Thermodesulfobacteriota bacterium]|nr:hypothetical protein [Thermodesulfobacteriota bacterium]